MCHLTWKLNTSCGLRMASKKGPAYAMSSGTIFLGLTTALSLYVTKMCPTSSVTPRSISFKASGDPHQRLTATWRAQGAPKARAACPSEYTRNIFHGYS